MSSIADGAVSIQTSSEAVPAPPAWLGEVTLLVGYFRKHNVLITTRKTLYGKPFGGEFEEARKMHGEHKGKQWG